MKTKILIVAAILAGIAALSRTAPRPGNPKLNGLTPAAAEKTMRNSYLDVSLADAGEKTKDGLAVIAEGLASPDEDKRRIAAQYAESLFIDVAHGKVQVDPANQSVMNQLVSLYKKNAKEQIQRMQRAFPESPTLAWLQNN